MSQFVIFLCGYFHGKKKNVRNFHKTTNSECINEAFCSVLCHTQIAHELLCVCVCVCVCFPASSDRNETNKNTTRKKKKEK